MTSVLLSLLLTLRNCARSQAALQLEVPALRQELEESSPNRATVGPSRCPDTDSKHVGRKILLGPPRIHGELLKLGIDTIARWTWSCSSARTQIAVLIEEFADPVVRRIVDVLQQTWRLRTSTGWWA